MNPVVDSGLLIAIIVIFASFIFLKLRQAPARKKEDQTGTLKTISDFPDAAFEIFAVHGLAADPEWTWIQTFAKAVEGGSQYSTNEEKISLHDLLRTRFPRARILSFADNSTHLGSDSVIKTTEEIGRSLLKEILEQRRRPPLPLIFIGHSMGGLVIKQALCSVGSESILEDTCGIIFLGTPHQGSSLSWLGSIISFLTKPLGSDTTLVMSLTVGNAGLSDLRRKFEDTLTKQVRRPHVVSFYETKATFLGRFSAGVIVPRDSASVHANEEVYVDADHSGLNKCFGAKPELFDKLANCIVKSRLPSRLEQVDKRLRTQYDGEKQYEKLNIVRLSGTVLPMENCYINLSIVEHYNSIGTARQKTAANSSFSVSSRKAVADVDKKSLVDLTTLFDECGGSYGNITPRKILIRGRAGIGKTTLCKKMVHDFLKWDLWKSTFDRVLWIPLRNLKGRRNSGYNLKSLFYDEFFSQILDGEKLADQLWEVVDGKTLFILDGIDEVLELLSGEGDMAMFLDNLFRQPSVIITSRPNVNLPPGITVDLELETIGFSEDQVEAYLQADPEYIPRANEIKSLLQKNWLLKSLVRIPIQLDALCYIWEDIDIDEAPETMTSIYVEIVNKLWVKDLKRLKNQLQNDHWFSQGYAQPLSSEIEAKAKNEIAFLECLAFHGLCNDTIDFSYRDRSKAFDHLVKGNLDYALNPTVDDVLPRLSFMRSSNSAQPSMPQNFHFIHLTYQEFFAARWFKRHWITNQPLCILRPDGPQSQSADDFVRRHKYIARFNIMWRFVSGLCDLDPHAGRTVDDLVDLFGEPPIDLLGVAHHRLLMHCLAEVVNSVSLRMVIEQRLSMWLELEFNLLDKPQILCEAEYPAGALDSAFQKGCDRRKQMILNAFQSKGIITPTALGLFPRWLKDPGLSSELCLGILKTLECHNEPFSTVLIEAVMSHMHHHNNPAVTYQASYVLGTQKAFPSSIQHRLLSQLLSHDDKIRKRAATALRGQSQIPQTILAWIGDGSESVKMEALEAFQQWTNPPAYITQAVMGLVGDEHSKPIRKAALETFRNQINLPDNVLRQVAAQLQDSKRAIRAAAFQVLRDRQGLPDDTLQAIVAFLSEEENFKFYSQAEYNHYSSTHPKSSMRGVVFKAAVARLGHDDAVCRKQAVDVLERLSPFSTFSTGQCRVISQQPVTLNALQEYLNPSIFFSRLNFPTNVAMAWMELFERGDEFVKRTANMILEAILVQLTHEHDYLGLSKFHTLLERPDLPLYIRDVFMDEYKAFSLFRLLSKPQWFRYWRSCGICLRLECTPKYRDSLASMVAADVPDFQSKLNSRALSAIIDIARRNEEARTSAMRMLKKRLPLDRNFLKDMVHLMESDTWAIIKDTIDILGADKSLPETILLKVIAKIDDIDPAVRYAAWRALKNQSDLPNAILTSERLYRVWLKQSLEEDFYFYVEDQHTYLVMPFNLGTVQLKGNSDDLLKEVHQLQKEFGLSYFDYERGAARGDVQRLN